MTTAPPWKEDLNVQMLIKLLRMTESSHDGEVLNAIRMANALLNKHDANWDEVLRGKVPMIDSDPFAKAPIPGAKASVIKHTDKTEINQYFNTLAGRDLGSFGDYVTDVFKWWTEKQFLTDKQYNVIRNAANRRR
jgi:hypothetical protein